MPSISPHPYIGRFAPAPTGLVHFGTLLTAVASYLQAKKNNGQWLIRMEDVDITRKIDGADKKILQTLEAFGFEWHGEIIYQSQQTEHYENALAELTKQSLIFPCTCSRKQLNKTSSEVYPGTCRNRQLPEKNEHALRLLVNHKNIGFNDTVMGYQSQNMSEQCGDFIIKRRDDLFAYQLAVVIDDALQNVSEVVRGCDLLDSTPRQIFLQQLLGYATPMYCHLPLAVDKQGHKISKSTGTHRIDINHRERLLLEALTFLGQKPLAELSSCSIDDIWKWGIDNWSIKQVRPTKSIPLY